MKFLFVCSLASLFVQKVAYFEIFRDITKVIVKFDFYKKFEVKFC